MTSPNEPGHPRAGEGTGSANGAPAGPPGTASADGGSPGPAAPRRESGDVPPWQRGPASRANAPRPTEGPRPADPQRPAERTPARAPGADARLGQFIAGGAGAPARETPPREASARDTEVVPTRAPERPEGPRPEGYASELPDLSTPAPRPPRPPGNTAPAEPRPSTPSPATRVQVAKKSQGPVRASMQIRRIDPWSTLKVSLVLSGALFFVWMIAVAFLYLVLGGMGVWSKLNSNVGDLLTSDSGGGGELISSGTIFGGATLIGLVNIVLLTAMATAGAFIYNLITDLVGGVEVTLADRD